MPDVECWHTIRHKRGHGMSEVALTSDEIDRSADGGGVCGVGSGG
jgi:hypothetical protein